MSQPDDPTGGRLERLADAHKVPGVTLPEYVELAAYYPNCAQALQYAHDVAMQDEPAGELAQLACQRHIRDMYRWEREEEGFPYTLDLYQAERMLAAVQMFRHVKGPLAGKRLRLERWQKFAIGSLFMWVHRETGARRFRVAFFGVPRGNGKSAISSALANAMLAIDGEGGAEVYAAAVSRDQARIVFDTAKQMVERDPEFRHRYGVEVTAHSIVQPGTASVFRPLSRDARSLDGLNVHCAVCDEIAQHRTREVWDVLMTATGKRTQPLMIAITTAGNNQATIGYELWKHTERVLRRQVEDESLFGIIYAADEGDDWTKPDTWQKANPNWNVSVMPDAIESMAKRAQTIASQQAAFMQKHLNVWSGAATQWLNMLDWRKCHDESINWRTFTSNGCVVGLDMATKLDLTALVAVFPQDFGGVVHYFIRSWAFLPAQAAVQSPVAHIQTWAEQGWLTITDGVTTDYDAVEKVIVDLHKETPVRDLAFDPWQSLALCKKLETKYEIPVIELRPTVQNFSPAMREIEGLVAEGRIHHDGNPVLEWCLGNVEVHEDRKGNIFPRKAAPDDESCKIDLAVAFITAISRNMALEAAGLSDPTAMIF